jgi:hypothetical protein
MIRVICGGLVRVIEQLEGLNSKNGARAVPWSRFGNKII